MTREIFVRETLIAAPVAEALDFDAVRLHIKAISTVEDLLLQSWIAAARQHFEEQTGRQLITATWEVWLDAFPRCNERIELPRPPLQNVISVSYVDGNGDVQTFTDGGSPDLPLYTVHVPAGPYAARGWIVPNAGQSWPVARCESGAVRIQFHAGYGDSSADVPELAAAALCFLVGHFDQFRSEVHKTTRGESLETVPFGVRQIIDGFKYSAYPSIVPRRAWPWG